MSFPRRRETPWALAFCVEVFFGYKGWQKKLRLNNDDPTYTEQQTIPNIGVRCYKIINYFNPSESVSLEIKDMGQDVEVYAYRVDNFGKGNEKKEFLKKLEPGIRETFKVKGAEQCLDIMCFNKHIDNDQTIDLEVSSLLGISGFDINLQITTTDDHYTHFMRKVSHDPFDASWTSIDIDSYTLTGTYGATSESSQVEIIFNNDGKSLKSFILKDIYDAWGEIVTTEINLHDVPLEWQTSGSLRCDLRDDGLCGIISLFKQTSDSGVSSGCKSGQLVLQLK